MAVIFEFDVVNSQVISGSFRTKSAGDAITVDWGDGGATQQFAGTTDQAWSKDYGSPFNGTVTISAADESVMTKFHIQYIDGSTLHDNTPYFDIGTLPGGLSYLNVSGSAYGTFADLSTSTISGTFAIYGTNTVTGLLSDIPRNIGGLYLEGNNTVSGNLSDLPSGLTFFNCQGSNTVSGNLSDLPSGLTVFYCTGSNTVTKGGSRVWPNTMGRVQINSSIGDNISDKDVDDLLIELADVTTWTGNKGVILTGTAIGKRSPISDAAASHLSSVLTTFTLNGVISAIDSGTLTAGKLYRIVATDDGRFHELAAKDYFTSDGTEECNATNTVLEVKTPHWTGVTIVSEKEGAVQNWASKDEGFNYNDPNGYTIEIGEAVSLGLPYRKFLGGVPYTISGPSFGKGGIW